MHNNIICVDCFCNNEKRIDILKESLQQFKKVGADILLTSHHPIPECIQKQVNYSLYTGIDDPIRRDEILPFITTPWLVYRAKPVNVSCELMFVYFDRLNHSFSTFRDFVLALRFAESIGKRWFVYTGFDNIICDEETSNINKIITNLEQNNKLGYFEILEGWDIVSSIFFIVDVEFFSSVFPLFNSKSDHLKHFEDHFIHEWALSVCVRPYIKSCLTNKSKDGGGAFPSSSINISRQNDYIFPVYCDVLKEKDKDQTHLVIYNYSKTKSCKLDVYINCQKETIYIDPLGAKIKTIDLRVCKCIDIQNNGEKLFYFDSSVENYLDKRGYIKFL